MDMRELCVSGSVVGRRVVPRAGACRWVGGELVDMGVLWWCPFRCCACVSTVWFGYAVCCFLRNSVVGLGVKVDNGLHKEVGGLEAMSTCEGLL